MTDSDYRENTRDLLKGIVDAYGKAHVNGVLDKTDLCNFIEQTLMDDTNNMFHQLMGVREIPTHDPQTGDHNPYYEELTGIENPLNYKGDEF